MKWKLDYTSPALQRPALYNASDRSWQNPHRNNVLKRSIIRQFYADPPIIWRPSGTKKEKNFLKSNTHKVSRLQNENSRATRLRERVRQVQSAFLESKNSFFWQFVSFCNPDYLALKSLVDMPWSCAHSQLPRRAQSTRSSFSYVEFQWRSWATQVFPMIDWGQESSLIGFRAGVAPHSRKKCFTEISEVDQNSAWCTSFIPFACLGTPPVGAFWW